MSSLIGANVLGNDTITQGNFKINIEAFRQFVEDSIGTDSDIIETVIKHDNTTSGLLATNVKEAIDELSTNKVDSNINGLTEKVIIDDADIMYLGDSDTTFSLKKFSWATLKSFFIGLTGNQYIEGLKTFASKVGTPNIVYKDTPVTITAWSYSGTTITLTVASHTFIVGDYIEVSGLLSTTYPANGIHVITSVTPTTIVFLLEATPTGTPTVSSASVKGYARVNGKVVDNFKGCTLTSKVAATTYYNTSGTYRDIFISGSGNPSSVLQLTVNGSIVARAHCYEAGTTSNAFLAFRLKNGDSYSLSGLTGSILYWYES